MRQPNPQSGTGCRRAGFARLARGGDAPSSGRRHRIDRFPRSRRKRPINTHKMSYQHF
jgi:hypothetical protein